MRRQSVLSLVSVLFFVLSVSLASGANEQEVLTLKDGTTLIGKIEKEEEGKIVFRTTGGVIMELSASDVKEISRSSEKTDGKKYQHTDPNYTRLLWGPTGRTLEAGSGHFADYYVFFPSFAYAPTSNFTLYVAMSIVPGVALDDQVFFLSPKLGIIQKEDFALSTGVMFVKIPEVDVVPGIAYGVSTWGTKDQNLTIGLGWGWVRDEGDWEVMDSPVVMAGGELRVSNSIKLLTENWWLPGVEDAKEHPVISIGVRFFGEHLSADLGFFHVVGTLDEDLPFIPWLDFVYNF